ncbi:MAG: hypothetical protein A2096_07960 [Spirochaetes bacterium GWF1_41_5]|nr:MAG: hypothetical protein A2096_07960 [Spirochaetes bacterium GWF1_41_5]
MCLFCSIITGEVPSYKIFETARTLCFLDVFPAADGHMLVVPKKHCIDLCGLAGEELADFSAAVQKACTLVKTRLKTADYNIICNTGRYAGQIIEHLHFHIIPRKEADGCLVQKAGEKKSEEYYSAQAALLQK